MVWKNHQKLPCCVIFLVATLKLSSNLNIQRRHEVFMFVRRRHRVKMMKRPSKSALNSGWGESAVDFSFGLGCDENWSLLRGCENLRCSLSDLPFTVCVCPVWVSCVCVCNLPLTLVCVCIWLFVTLSSDPFDCSLPVHGIFLVQSILLLSIFAVLSILMSQTWSNTEWWEASWNTHLNFQIILSRNQKRL